MDPNEVFRSLKDTLHTSDLAPDRPTRVRIIAVGTDGGDFNLSRPGNSSRIAIEFENGARRLVVLDDTNRSLIAAQLKGRRFEDWVGQQLNIIRTAQGSDCGGIGFVPDNWSPGFNRLFCEGPMHYRSA